MEKAAQLSFQMNENKKTVNYPFPMKENVPESYPTLSSGTKFKITLNI